MKSHRPTSKAFAIGTIQAYYFPKYIYYHFDSKIMPCEFHFDNNSRLYCIAIEYTQWLLSVSSIAEALWYLQNHPDLKKACTITTILQ